MDWVVAQVKLDPCRVVEVLDWCHAVHHLSVALAALPLTEDQRKELYKRLRGLLKDGKSRDVLAELACWRWTRLAIQPCGVRSAI